MLVFVKQIRYRTRIRTFLIEEGVCKAVYLGERPSPEKHLAIGRRFLGSVANHLERDAPLYNPPRVGHYLAFAIPGGRKEGRLYSEAPFEAFEDVTNEPTSMRTPLPVSGPSPTVKITRKNTPPSPSSFN